MRVRKSIRDLQRLVALALVTFLSGALSPVQAATSTGTDGMVDLGLTPPDLTASVPPNLVVTFDDSGSMGNQYMGDNRPYDDGSWSGPWGCAGVIDPTGTSAGALSSHVMNGVYYNPAITYVPPVKADGTSFPNADATLVKVWTDGVSANRPLSPTGATTYTNFTGTKTSSSDTRWKCPQYSTYPSTVLGNSGGPYYFQYTGPAITLDAFGNPNATGLTSLYTASNWTAVKVPTSQYQNWANWWSYYHNRNLMARTSISRVFANNAAKTSDGGYGNSLRVVWQNLNTSTYKLPTTAIISSLIDTAACTSGGSTSPSTTQQSGAIKTPPNCYRSAFYNWIFQVPASGSTPSRSATDRAGKFFTRGFGNTDSTGNLEDPYWQPSTTAGTGHELYCSQNFHVLVTDGLWNVDSGLPTLSSLTQPGSGLTLPDGVAFPSPTGSGSVTSIYKPAHDAGGGPSLSDIAFHYWGTDLRTDLYDPTNSKIVPPYLPDKSTAVFGLSGQVASNVPSTQINPEIYFNPVNDPATWPHMAEFMVGLGVNGTLNYTQNTDCTDTSASAKDACDLRKGNTNSSGAVGWPTPSASANSGSGEAENIDDTWHAALAGRGSFFSAANPDALVNQLTQILNSIQAHVSTTVGLAVSVSTATTSTAGFAAGYNSGDWSGNLPQYSIDPTTGQPSATPLRDAGCILSGATATKPCQTTGETAVTQNPTPANRHVFTLGSGTTKTQLFQTLTALTTQEQCLLNNGTWSGSSCSGGDGFGQKRIDYLRGDTSNEAGGSTPQFRARGSLLGAIVNSQPIYVGSPGGGFFDLWPAGSPELATGAQKYSDFIAKENGDTTSSPTPRAPMLYAAANDGMLHAFRASDGVERWAYVPATVINNGEATQYTASAGGFVPTVDGGITTQDVFFSSDQSWHTILVGSLRLGGRGIYALDITDGDADPKVLWEFSNTSTNGADLGYTYATPNIARLSLNGGTWVVLLASGYMPTGSSGTDPAVTNESLFVLNAETGAFISELKTTGIDPKAYGLNTPAVWDYSANQVDDVAAAGDLMGNLWRFDLSAASAGSWKVEKMFQTPQPPTLTFPAPQPITVKPVSMSDPNNNGNPIWIFGTGKYLSNNDNVSSGVPTQFYYGIRDFGTNSSNYPINATQLTTQTMTETTSGVRSLSNKTVPAVSGTSCSTGLACGWDFQMIDAGERNVITGTPLYSLGEVLLTSLLPKGDDPCAPGRGGAIMLINGPTGGVPANIVLAGGGVFGSGSGSYVIGKKVNNPPAAGSLPVLEQLGGGRLMIPGQPGLNISDTFWHRRAWRELVNGL